MSRRLGAKRDHADSRDWAICQAPWYRPGTTGDVLIEHPDCAIRDQDGTGSCVAFSLVDGVRLGYLVGNGETCEELSALDNYFLARELEGGAIIDQGCYPRLALKAIQKSGIAGEHVWPFRAADVDRHPSWSARRDGYHRRGVRGYYGCYGADNVATAIRAKRPVQVCWDVTYAFMDLGAHECVYEMAGVPAGGHAMLAVGVQTVAGETRFVVRNSWGYQWGNAGYWTCGKELMDLAHDVRAIDV